MNGRPAGVVPRRKGAVKGQGRCCKGDLYMRKAIYAGFPRRSIILCWKRGEAGEHDCTEMTFQLPIVRPYKVQRSCLPTEQPGRFAPFPPAQRSAFLCFFPLGPFAVLFSPLRLGDMTERAGNSRRSVFGGRTSELSGYPAVEHTGVCTSWGLQDWSPSNISDEKGS